MLQPRQTEKPAVGIVLDTALSRVDDVMAMALLYGLDGKKEERLVSVSVSRTNVKAASYADVVGRFYAGAVSALRITAATSPVSRSVWMSLV